MSAAKVAGVVVGVAGVVYLAGVGVAYLADQRRQGASTSGIEITIGAVGQQQARLRLPPGGGLTPAQRAARIAGWPYYLARGLLNFQ